MAGALRKSSEADSNEAACKRQRQPLRRTTLMIFDRAGFPQLNLEWCTGKLAKRLDGSQMPGSNGIAYETTLAEPNSLASVAPCLQAAART